MAKDLLCPACDKRRKELAIKYGEYYESVEGKSKSSFFCDGCFPLNEINEGDLCFASCTFPDKNHFNYEVDKPEVWMNDYIIPFN